MRLLKKILRIIAIVLPCSLFFVTPSYALEYDLHRIPYFSPTYILSNGSPYNLSTPLLVDYSASLAPDFTEWDIKAPWSFNAYKSGNNCVYGRPSGVNVSDYYNWTYMGNGIKIGGQNMYLNSSSSYPLSECLLLNSNLGFSGFGNNSIPNFDSSTIPLVGSPFMYNFRSFLPYNTDYSYFGLDYEYGVNDDGSPGRVVIYDLDLFGHALNDFSELSIPIVFNASPLGSLTSGRSISVETTFGTFNNDDSFDYSNLLIHLYTNYVYQDGNSVFGESQTSQCSFRSQSRFLLKIICDVELDHDVLDDNIAFNINLHQRDTSIPYAIHLSCDDKPFCLDFYKFNIITDHDYTPSSDSIDGDTFGHSQEDAPGYPGSDSSYYNSLTNLFDFSFINPFNAFFALFTDNSGCVDITTIAGMINSTETEYCPWFDSSTRNILTPVLGISGIMLVFGFLVHWLRSSSGNLFEDSDKGGK